jgi:rhamnogalacturonan endolyase
MMSCSKRRLALALVAAPLCVFGCGNSGSGRNSGATGGTTTSGGTATAGGTTSAGATNAAGTITVGGTTGVAGSAAAGGATGAAGTTSSDSSTSAGGTGGGTTGGTGPAGGATSVGGTTVIGGTTRTGGAGTAGSASGGAAIGGTTRTGGAGTAGAASGGVATGGAAIGGTTTGGAGGVATGGATGTGGMSTGGAVGGTPASGKREMESLDRGVIAINQGGGKVYVGWRMFGLDPGSIAFNVYRSAAGAAAVKLNTSPITATTDYVDAGADVTKSNAYSVAAVVGGAEQAASATYTLAANAPAQQYLSIPLRDGGLNYAQANVGDLDGDGQYELVVKWSQSANVDPGSHTTATAVVYVDAYKLNGTFLWRVDLGWNLESGSDFTPLLVYDVDGDGKAEVITKTAEGTKDGTGVTIGDTDGDGKTDYRNSDGRVLSGPEFMSVFRGTDGKELARTNWIARGSVSDWGDSTGNRSCRQQMGIAYLDGAHPSIIMSRGVYAYQVVQAWDFRSGALSKLWAWDNGGKGQSGEWYSSAQCLRMGDANGDGYDEVLKGPLALDHTGKTLWDQKLIKGHGDYFHIGILNPARSGLQIFRVLEAAQANGVAMLDAATGTVLWGKTIAGDASRGYSSHIDSRQKGAQCWAGQIDNDLLNYDGSVLCNGTSPSNGDHWAPIWWEGGLTRSITDEFSGNDGVHINRWNGATCSLTELMKTGSGTRITQTIADILGDWREELVIGLPNEVRVYTTTIPAGNRLYTLMHNPLYRLNVGQSAQRNFGTGLPDYYLGTGMTTPPAPDIKYVGPPR